MLSTNVQHRRLSPNIFLSTLRFFFTMTFLQVCVMLFRRSSVFLLLASSMNDDEFAAAHLIALLDWRS